MRRLEALGLVVLAASCQRGSGGDAPAARRRAALVQALSGRVELLRTSSVDWVAANEGAELFEEDRVRTFKGAWAQLVFSGGSSLRVAEESLLALGGGLMVERGRVDGELAAGLRLRTPTMEAETLSARDIGFR